MDGGRRCRATLPAYKSAGLTMAEFEGPHYQRIGQLQKLIGDKDIDINLRRPMTAPRQNADIAASV